MDKKSKMKKMINRFVLIYLQGHLHLIVTIVWHKKVKALPA